MLDKIQGILERSEAEPATKKSGIRKKLPSHVAFSIAGNIAWAKRKKADVSSAYDKCFEVTNRVMRMQVKKNIPIFTIYLLTEDMRKSEHFSLFLDKLVLFFEGLKDDKFIHKNRVRVSVLGKWYDLPGRVVEPIKDAIDSTRDYDLYFLNLCVNYDGQEEIADACRLIARKVRAGRIDIDQITKSEIKENIYASYFLPPDVVVCTYKRYFTGLLLWDSVRSTIYFTPVLWPEFTESELDKAIEYWRGD